jgi:hypothetical protein
MSESKDSGAIPHKRRKVYRNLAEIAAPFLTDTLTELTRTRQKDLLVASTIAILLSLAVITGKSGNFHGIPFEIKDTSLVRPIAAIFTGYLLVIFCVSVYQDIKTRQYRHFLASLSIEEVVDPLKVARDEFYIRLNDLNKATESLELERDRLVAQIEEMHESSEQSKLRGLLDVNARQLEVVREEFRREAEGIPETIIDQKAIGYADRIVAAQSRLTLVRDGVDIVFPILLAAFAIYRSLPSAIYRWLHL